MEVKEVRKSLLRKQEIVNLYREKLSRSNGFIVLFDFSRIDAQPLSELRLRVREAGGEIVVGKNRLMLRAFQDTPLSEKKEIFRGPTAMLFAYKEDVVLPTKELVNFLKDYFQENWEGRIKGGLLEGRFLEQRQIIELSKLPSREELIGKLLFVLKAPIQNLAYVLKAPVQNLALVLKSVSEKS